MKTKNKKLLRRNKSGMTQLCRTIIYGQRVLSVNDITEENATVPNKDGLTPLHYICIYCCDLNNETNIVKKLISCGADVNTRSKKTGYTPLHYVCQYNFYNYNIVKLLLSNGAIRDLPNKKGETPMDILLKHPARVKSSYFFKNAYKLFKEYFPVNPYNETLIFGFNSENSSLFNFVRNSAFDKNLLPLIYCLFTGKQNKAYDQLQNDILEFKSFKFAGLP